MYKFYPKHPPYMEIFVKAICIVLMVWCGLKYSSDIVFISILLLVVVLLCLDAASSLIHFRNPKPTVLVFSRGIVANYQLFEWKNIRSIYFNDEEQVFRIYLSNNDVTKIRFGNIKETPDQFREVIESHFKSVGFYIQGMPNISL